MRRGLLTAVAAAAIRRIAGDTDVLVGAGTVVRPEQVDERFTQYNKRFEQYVGK